MMLANRFGSFGSRLLVLLLICLCVVTVDSQSQLTPGRGCDRLWRSRLNLGINDGFQLQACCNVSSVTLQPFKNVANWQLSDEVFKFNFSYKNEYYSDVELSDCPKEKELVSGFVESTPNGVCNRLSAQILNIPPDSIPLNRWFVVCYEHESGCKSCHLDVFCENEYSSTCADVYMQSSVSAVTNESMALWIEIGRYFPFIKDSNIQITVRSQAKNTVVGRYQKTPQTSKKVDMNITSLEPDEWYLVSACVVISPPTRFLDNYGITLSTSTKPLLCREGSHRTASTKSAATLTFIIAIILAIFMIAF